MTGDLIAALRERFEKQTGDLIAALRERFEKQEREIEAARLEAAQWKDACHAALVALHESAIGPASSLEARAALAELLTGYPPATHTELVLIAPGETFQSEKPAYVLRRRCDA